TPRAPRQHAARHLHEAKPAPLQHHERFYLRVLQRKTPTEHRQRAAVHPHESRSRITNRFAQNRPQYHAKKSDARRPQQARAASATAASREPSSTTSTGAPGTAAFTAATTAPTAPSSLNAGIRMSSFAAPSGMIIAPQPGERGSSARPAAA